MEHRPIWEKKNCWVENVVDEEEYDQTFCTDVQTEVASIEEQDEANYLRSDHNEGIWAECNVKSAKKIEKGKKREMYNIYFV